MLLSLFCLNYICTHFFWEINSWYIPLSQKKILEPNELIIERSMWTCQEFASSLLLALDCCACNSYGIVHLVSSFLLKVDKYLPDEFAVNFFRKTIFYPLLRPRKIYYYPCIWSCFDSCRVFKSKPIGQILVDFQ